MKPGIHPKWYPEAQVICACGNTFTVGSTQPVIRTDVCSACHPFFTGEQRIVDTAGQVERFMRRLERREEIRNQPAPTPASPAPAKTTRRRTAQPRTSKRQPVPARETEVALAETSVEPEG